MTSSKYFNTALILLLVLSALPTVSASGNEEPESVYVLYIGNDY